MSFTGTAAVAIRSFVERKLLHGDALGLDDEASLVAAGILDSASLVMVLAFVEEELGVVVPGDVELSQVESVAAIARLAQRLADA